MREKTPSVRGFILYRIWYGEDIVYIGRTKQPLQNRIRGHLFKKPMYRSINIELVTKIEYAIFQSEADMNLYEIYFINIWKPTLNIDDKCKDNLTVTLPDVEWKLFITNLWDKWKTEIKSKNDAYRMRESEKAAQFELKCVMRKKWHDGEISEETYNKFLESEKSIAENLEADEIWS